MGFVDSFIIFLEDLARKVPVEIFVFIGGLIEEIIAPIPSPLVMLLGGGVLDTQKAPLFMIFIVGVIGAVSKTLGCWFWYILADKAEDLTIGKFGKLIGFSHKEIEGLGKHFNNSEKDFYIILIGRAIPIMPSTPISVVAGVIKINLRKFLLASFIGNYIRTIMFMYLGYVSHETYRDIVNGFDSLESIMQIIIAISLILVLGYVYSKRSKGDFLDRVKKLKFFEKK